MPRLKHHDLSTAKVKALNVAGDYADGGGLVLRVEKSGAKRWVLRATVSGKARNIGLGGFPTVSLAEARQAAQETRLAIREGRDPAEERRAERQQQKAEAALPTLQEAAETVIKLRRPSWTNTKHAAQWKSSLATYVHPTIGSKRVDEVTTSDVMGVLEPIWVSKPETASRVRQRLEIVFDWAIARSYRTDANPAGRHLLRVLPKIRREKEHHPALDYTEVPAALRKVRLSTAYPLTQLAFEFMVLTASRSGEVRLADWEEIDRTTSTWTVPAVRMKARKEHRVPLSAQALRLLHRARGATGGVGVIFHSPAGKALHDSTISKLLRDNGIEAVPHGFRSSFRDWVIEQTDTSWAVGEAALAHTIGNSTEQAYARSDLFDRRRVLMQQWADYITQ